MMIALDTKLHALLLDIIDGRVRLSAAEEIKRLFAEAGYRTIDKDTKTIYAPTISNEYRTFMTGVEWLTRFKAELGKPQVFVGYGYDSVGYDEDDVLDAAMKASGINDKGDN